MMADVSLVTIYANRVKVDRRGGLNWWKGG